MKYLLMITRELIKLIMFGVSWGFPIYLSRQFGSSKFLWFFVISMLLTIAIFSHYEDLKKND